MTPRKSAPARKTPAQEIGPKKETGGNGLADQAWIAEMLEAGELHAPIEDERPPEFLYDVIYQWDGLADDINPDFFEFFRLPSRAATPRNCNANAYVRDRRGGYVIDSEWNRLRRQCLGRPALGTNVCHTHGGNIPSVKAAAARVLAQASEVVAIRLVGLTDHKDEVDNPISHKDRIAASNSVLDRAGVKGSAEVEITAPGFQRVIDKMFGDDSNEEE